MKANVDVEESPLSRLWFSVVQEEAAGGAVARLRAAHHHLRQPEERLRRAGQVPGEDGGEFQHHRPFYSFIYFWSSSTLMSPTVTVVSLDKL